MSQIQNTSSRGQSKLGFLLSILFALVGFYAGIFVGTERQKELAADEMETYKAAAGVTTQELQVQLGARNKEVTDYKAEVDRLRQQLDSVQAEMDRSVSRANEAIQRANEAITTFNSTLPQGSTANMTLTEPVSVEAVTQALSQELGAMLGGTSAAPIDPSVPVVIEDISLSRDEAQRLRIQREGGTVQIIDTTETAVSSDVTSGITIVPAGKSATVSADANASLTPQPRSKTIIIEND